MKMIKIVTAVERTPATILQEMTRISKTEVRIPSGVSWETLKIKPHAQLTLSNKKEDGNTVWTAKLVFKTCEEFSSIERYAFRCRLSDGRYCLIGTNERPYPVVNVVISMPENVTENQLTEVTVNWQSPQFVPYIHE